MPPQMPKLLTTWRRWATAIKRDLGALAHASRDPRVPWYAKALVVCLVAYALSPIDLIPDPIPVLGYLDDLLLLPLGIVIAIKLIPPAVFAECRLKAEATAAAPMSRGRWIAAVGIVIAWIAIAILVMLFVRRMAG